MTQLRCSFCDGLGFLIEHFDGEYAGWQPGPSEYGRPEREADCPICLGAAVVECDEEEPDAREEHESEAA